MLGSSPAVFDQMEQGEKGYHMKFAAYIFSFVATLKGEICLVSGYEIGNLLPVGLSSVTNLPLLCLFHKRPSFLVLL